MRHAWSVRLLLLAALLEAGAAVLPLLSGTSIVWTAVLTGLAGVFTSAAFVARLLGQKEFEDEQKA